VPVLVMAATSAELAERLSAEVKRASEQERIATAVDEVIDSHEQILAALAK